MIKIIEMKENNNTLFKFNYVEKSQMHYYDKNKDILPQIFYAVYYIKLYCNTLEFENYKQEILNRFPSKFFDYDNNEIFFINNNIQSVNSTIGCIINMYGYIIFINGRYFTCSGGDSEKDNYKDCLTIKIFKFLNQINNYYE